MPGDAVYTLFALAFVGGDVRYFAMKETMVFKEVQVLPLTLNCVVDSVINTCLSLNLLLVTKQTRFAGAIHILLHRLF